MSLKLLSLKLPAAAARPLSFLLLFALLFLTGCGGDASRSLPALAPAENPSGVPSLNADGLPANGNGDSSSANSSGGAASSDGKVTFLAAGDVIIHEAVFTDAMSRAKALAAAGGYQEKYEFTSMFENVAPLIQKADLSFVNFECPIAGDGYGALGYPNFNAPEAAGRAMEALGFDVVNLANNHMLDMDGVTTGLKNTVEFWKGRNLLEIGGYTKADYDNLRILTKNGVKIAFLSYTYGTNSSRINSGSPEYIVPKIDDAVIVRQLRAAKSAADAVIVSMHWGDETSYATAVTKANSEQKRLAKLICENGGDVILGHHSHALQTVERLRASDGHETLCYYSLGNFLSTQHPYTNLVGGFASFTLRKQAGGGVKIEDASLIPHLTYYDGNRANLEVLPLSAVTREKVSSHGSQKRSDYNGKSAFTLEDLYKTVQTAVPAEYLPAYLQ